MNNDHAQDDGLSLAAQRRIDRRCLAFEDSWKSGNPQTVESVLQEAPEAERAALLRELLLIDIAYRRNRGETPTSEEYEARFSAHAIIIADVFQQGFATVDRSTHADELERGGLHIRCPHCHNPVEIVERAQPAKIACPSCGSVFNLATDRLAADQDAAEAADRRSPRRIAHFELLGLLGEGAFGAVWKAHDTKLNRVVAIKIPRNGQFDSKGTDRFLREAQAPAELHHPNIVAVYEVGRDGDVGYIISEFIEGQTLDRWLEAQGRRLTTREAAELCATIAETLQYAHEHHVVHRDLKPSNIMMDASGQPHLMDFGLAKREAGEITMTIDGQIMGTPAYMSPEQARGEAHLADGRTDVYSLGVILFELLTGERPFRGELRMLLRQVIEDDPPSVRRLNSRVDPNIATICTKCLEKPLDRRYVTAEALADDLRHFLAGEPIHARPVGKPERLWRWCKRNPVVAGLTAVVALTLVAGTLISSIFAVQAYTSEKRAVAERDRANKNANRADQKASEANANLEKESEARREALAEKQRANQEAIEASAEKDRAEKQLLRSEWLAYAKEIAAAKAEWEANHVEAAWGHMDACRVDFRGWEHDYLYTLFTRGQRSISGRTDNDGDTSSVYSVAFSPDGKRIVSGGWFGKVKVWDTTTGRETLTLYGHPVPAGCLSIVWTAAFSPDGKRIVSGGGDGKVKVWDATSGREMLALDARAGCVHSVAISPDGKRIVSGDWGDGKVKVWDATSGREMLALDARVGCVHSVAISPDGKRIVSGSADKTARVWDATTGREMLTLKGHTGDVSSVAFSPDGKRITSGSEDRTVRVWDATSGRETLTLVGHTAQVLSVAFSPDGKRIVSGSEDNTLKIWDAATGRETSTFRGHTRPVVSVAFSPDGKRIASGGETARVWDATSGHDGPNFMQRTDRVSCVAFSPDGKRIISGNWNNTVTVWDAKTGQAMFTLAGHTAAVNSVTFSPDGKRIVSGSEDDTARVWDATTGQEMLTLRGQTGGVTCVAFSLDGKRIASASCGWDGTVMVWDGLDGKRIASASGGWNGTVMVRDARSGQKVLALARHAALVHSIAFSPDGKRIVSGTHSRNSSRTLKVWDVASGRETLTLKGYTTAVNSVTFSPDGKWIVSGSSDGTVEVRDATTGREMLTLKGHSGAVSSVAFSPDGKRIASGSEDRTVRVWDATSGQELATLTGHTAQVWSVAFSPDGKQIVSGSGHNTLKIWDVETGRETSTFEGHTSSVIDGPSFTQNVSSVAISPDGQRIVSCGEDCCEATVWDAVSGQETLMLEGAGGLSVTSVAFSPDGKRIVCGYIEEWQYIDEWGKVPRVSTLGVWDAKTGQEVLTIRGYTAAVRSVAFSPDGKRIVSGSEDDTARVWDAKSGEEMLTLKGHTHTVSSVTFSPDGNRIASGSADETARVWDATTGREMLTLKGHTGAVSSVAFSPDGKRIVSGGWDDKVKVWDATSGQEILTADADCVRSVAFSPDGKRIISGSCNNALTVWDATTGHEMLTLRVPGAVASNVALTSVAFSPDGKRIVSGSSAEPWNPRSTLRVWDTTSTQEVAAENGWTWGEGDAPEGTEEQSGWMTREQCNDLSRSQWGKGRYFTRVEGRLMNGREQFRARWASKPDGRFDPYWVYGVSRDEFRKVNSERVAGGFELTSQQSFTGNDGTDKIQATWVTNHSRHLAAETYWRAGRPDLAVPLFEETLNLRKAKLGPDDPETLRAMNTLGVAYRSAGMLDKSILLLEETLKLEEAKVGREHLDTLWTMANLGVNYRNAGRVAKALPLLEDAYRAAKKYPPLRWVGSRLLDAYVRAAKTERAVALANGILADARKQLPKQSPQLAAQLAATASLLLQAKAYSEAEPPLRESLAIYEKTEPEAWTTFNTKSLLGGALLGQKKYAAAKPLLLAGYEGMKQREAKIPPWDKVRLDEALERLIQLAKAQGKKQEETKWQTELEVRKKSTK